MDILICLTLNLDYEVKDKKEKLHRASLFVFIDPLHTQVWHKHFRNNIQSNELSYRKKRQKATFKVRDSKMVASR